MARSKNRGKKQGLNEPSTDEKLKGARVLAADSTNAGIRLTPQEVGAIKAELRRLAQLVAAGHENGGQIARLEALIKADHELALMDKKCAKLVEVCKTAPFLTDKQEEQATAILAELRSMKARQIKLIKGYEAKLARFPNDRVYEAKQIKSSLKRAEKRVQSVSVMVSILDAKVKNNEQAKADHGAKQATMAIAAEHEMKELLDDDATPQEVMELLVADTDAALKQFGPTKFAIGFQISLETAEAWLLGEAIGAKIKDLKKPFARIVESDLKKDKIAYLYYTSDGMLVFVTDVEEVRRSGSNFQCSINYVLEHWEFYDLFDHLLGKESADYTTKFADLVFRLASIKERGAASGIKFVWTEGVMWAVRKVDDRVRQILKVSGVRRAGSALCADESDQPTAHVGKSGKVAIPMQGPNLFFHPEMETIFNQILDPDYFPEDEGTASSDSSSSDGEDLVTTATTSKPSSAVGKNAKRNAKRYAQGKGRGKGRGRAHAKKVATDLGTSSSNTALGTALVDFE